MTRKRSEPRLMNLHGTTLTARIIYYEKCSTARGKLKGLALLLGTFSVPWFQYLFDPELPKVLVLPFVHLNVFDVLLQMNDSGGSPCYILLCTHGSLKWYPLLH